MIYRVALGDANPTHASGVQMHGFRLTKIRVANVTLLLCVVSVSAYTTTVRKPLPCSKGENNRDKSRLFVEVGGTSRFIGHGL